jgi:hypothetical protein
MMKALPQKFFLVWTLIAATLILLSTPASAQYFGRDHYLEEQTDVTFCQLFMNWKQPDKKKGKLIAI